MVSCLFHAICDMPQIAREQTSSRGPDNRQFFIATKMAQDALSDGSKRCAIEDGGIYSGFGILGPCRIRRGSLGIVGNLTSRCGQIVGTTLGLFPPGKNKIIRAGEIGPVEDQRNSARELCQLSRNSR